MPREKDDLRARVDRLEELLGKEIVDMKVKLQGT